MKSIYELLRMRQYHIYVRVYGEASGYIAFFVYIFVQILYNYFRAFRNNIILRIENSSHRCWVDGRMVSCILNEFIVKIKNRQSLYNIFLFQRIWEVNTNHNVVQRIQSNTIIQMLLQVQHEILQPYLTLILLRQSVG